MKMPIDLYSLTPAERTLFDGCPEALDSGCETVCCFYLRYSSEPNDNFYRVPAGANTKIFSAITGREYFF